MASLKDLPLNMIIEIRYFFCDFDGNGEFAKNELFGDIVALILAAFNKRTES